jgi:hypothetical protein
MLLGGRVGEDRYQLGFNRCNLIGQLLNYLVKSFHHSRHYDGALLKGMQLVPGVILETKQGIALRETLTTLRRGLVVGSREPAVTWLRAARASGHLARPFWLASTRLWHNDALAAGS